MSVWSFCFTLSWLHSRERHPLGFHWRYRVVIPETVRCMSPDGARIPHIAVIILHVATTSSPGDQSPRHLGCQDTISESMTGNWNFSRTSHLIQIWSHSKYFLWKDILLKDFWQSKKFQQLKFQCKEETIESQFSKVPWKALYSRRHFTSLYCDGGILVSLKQLFLSSPASASLTFILV